MVDGLFARLPSCTSVCSWLLRACQQVILLYGQITSVMHHAWMHPLVYICSLINGHLCCFMFWLWWIILLSTFMYKFMCGCMSSIFLGTYKRRHIITTFNILMSCQTTFLTHCTSLHSHQHSRRVPLFPSLGQHSLWLIFLLYLS